jgi:ureidoacrylate peracid hydrolase
MRDVLIPLQTTAMLFHQMTVSAVRGRGPDVSARIEASQVVTRSVSWAAEMRRLSVPLFWVSIAHRADRADRVELLTDRSIAESLRPRAQVDIGSPQGQNIVELPVRPEDHVIVKRRYDPFIGTSLELELRALGIDTILMAGIQGPIGAIESCVRGAYDRDYNVVVLRDICFGVDAEAWTWSLDRVLQYFARVMTTDSAQAILQSVGKGN